MEVTMMTTRSVFSFLQTFRRISFRESLLRSRTCSLDPQKRCASTDAPLDDFDLGSAVVAVEPSKDEARLKKLRNISRLQKQHWNILHGRKPHEKEIYPYHYSVEYQRGIFATYGSGSNVYPGICWPTNEELEDRLEWERVTYPFKIKKVVKMVAAKKALLEQQRWERDEMIAKNITKMAHFQEQLRKKQEDEEKQREVVQARRQRLVAEVREHFNYSINERDDRFKQELTERARALREKEQRSKKAMKTEKKEQMRARAAEKARQKMLEQSGLSPE